MMRSRLVIGLMLFFSLTLRSTGQAWAHGGGVPRLSNADAGPYWVSAWTEPDPLRVGRAHVTVAVSEPNDSGGARREAGPPVLDATVQVQFAPLDRAGETLTAPARRGDAANKLFYEADLALPETGAWQVTVEVQGPAGTGRASFEAQVSAPASFNWRWIPGLGLLVLVAAWAVQRFRRTGEDSPVSGEQE